MGCACGLNRATNRSEGPWDGRSTKFEAIEPSGAIGNWSVVPSPFAGTITAIAAPMMLGFQSIRVARSLSRKNRFLSRLGEPGKKMSGQTLVRPQLSWPKALREVRAWLEPWILLQRYWRAWSTQPLPLPLQQLLDALALGVPQYCSIKNTSSRRDGKKGRK